MTDDEFPRRRGADEWDGDGRRSERPPYDPYSELRRGQDEPGGDPYADPHAGPYPQHRDRQPYDPGYDERYGDPYAGSARHPQDPYDPYSGQQYGQPAQADPQEWPTEYGAYAPVDDAYDAPEEEAPRERRRRPLTRRERAKAERKMPGKRGKKARRRRRRRIVLSVFALLIVGMSTFVGIVYVNTDVPRPEDILTNQVSVMYYSDGAELTRIGQENRTLVKIDKVPKYVQHAVLAAENRSYYSDPGFSFTGILRAAWNNVTGGDVQGGSTITQQYVKNAYLTDERTVTRKFKELIISIKLEQEYSKDQILEFYLNTIYYGRGAYGIEAAAETYFGKPVDQLSVAEGAVIASSIRSPAGYDPQNHPQAASDRWDFVLDGMVKQDWLKKAERDQLVYPAVLPVGPGALNQATGPEGLIVSQVKEELEALGIDPARMNRDGLRITTTVNPGAQQQLVAAVQGVMTGQPENLRTAAVSIDPLTGAVYAYYGGPNGTGFDYAQAYRQPGSSFKPFTLAAALQEGIGVYTRRDGSSPQNFPGRETPVRNSGGASCGDCTLKEAITRSLNTTFYGLALEIGPEKVAAVAHAAGVVPVNPDTGEATLQKDNVTGAGIGIGEYEVTAVDQASSFATFATGGVYRPPHFIQKVTDSNGEVIYEAVDQGKQVLPANVANDVSFALEDVAEYSHDALDEDRPVAAKTGTVQLDDVNNKDAWMVGYTPQLSTSVWVGSDGSDALINADGDPIYGSGLPGKIWKAYMDVILAGSELIPLPSKPSIGPATEPAPPTTDAPATETEAPQTTAPPTTSAPPTTPVVPTDPPITTPPCTTDPNDPNPPWPPLDPGC